MTIDIDSLESPESEVQMLRRRVAELEQLAEERERTIATMGRMVAVLEETSDLVSGADTGGNVLFLNRGGRRLLGIRDDEPVGMIAQSHPEWAARLIHDHAIPTAIRDGIWRGESALLTRDGREIPVSQVILCHRGPNGDVEFLSTIIRDISERKQAEETIRQQAAALMKLSTPLIPISDDIVVMPLIGLIDSARAGRVMTTLLEGIVQSGARVAILDITGVGLVDEEVATALVSAARAVELLGAKVVLTGIRPEVARTLVDLGVDLGSIATRSNLQGGIRYAMRASPTGTWGEVSRSI